MRLENFKSQLSMLLRDIPRGTTADIAPFAVAWWSGQCVTYAFLRDDASGQIEEEFDLDDYAWSQWQPEFEAWAEAPTFSVRSEILNWLKDAPPSEAG
ncbi:hypothetical protein [Paraburkholderia sp.]|jgi:hypothetical protein|uniref:hypothetical protein n=1 Tax=Paraburkholderia sp. TaxID=1926495 RepID=UPI002F3F506A